MKTDNQRMLDQVRKENEIQEKNSLLSKFMDLVYNFDGMYHHVQLFNPNGTPKRSGALIESEWKLWNPHTNWNDLMEVVEKIENLNEGIYQVDILQEGCRINERCVTKFDFTVFKVSLETTKIQSVYNACVEFIKWYNQQK